MRQTFYYFVIKKEVIQLISEYKNKNDKTSKRYIKIAIPKKNKSVGQKCYFFAAVKIFNAMPSAFKQINNTSQINLSWIYRVKKWLLLYKH